MSGGFDLIIVNSSKFSLPNDVFNVCRYVCIVVSTINSSHLFISKNPFIMLHWADV